MYVKYGTVNLKKLIVVPMLLFFLFFQNISSGDERNDVILRRFPTQFRVKFEINLKKNSIRFPAGSKTTFLLSCAIPTSNIYHEVGEIATNQGEIIKFSNSNQRVVRVVTENRLPDKITIEYDITIYRIYVDLDKIRTIYPYNKNSAIYRNNTGAHREIEPEHPEIVRLGNLARAKSGNLLEYAINAYKELKNRIKSKTTGKYDTLTNIFKNNGGDCAAHSKVLVSLLRNNGIPARYIVGGVINKNNGFDRHVWVEFYLERYGWIPADAAKTFFLPYIGYFNGRALGFYRGGNFKQKFNETEFTMEGFQDFRTRYWFRGGRPSGDYSYDKKFTITLIRPSDAETFYNSKENHNNLTVQIIKRINVIRNQKGLKPFTYSATLSEQLNKQLKNKLLHNRVFSITQAMKKINYRTRVYSYYRSILADFMPDNSKFIAQSFISRGLQNKPSLTEIAIGYFYSDSHISHHYIILVTHPERVQSEERGNR